MLQRAFLSAFAALLLSAVLVQAASAYPSTARSGATTVTGTYNPLDYDLTLADGTGALDYRDGFSFQAIFSGKFTATGASGDASGPAGNWRLLLSDAIVGSSDNGTVITLNSTGPGLLVGRLTYLGGLVPSSPLSPGDTPEVNDYFDLFTTLAAPVLTVVCADGTAVCNDYVLTLSQKLEHIGPYVTIIDGTFRSTSLDTARLNEECVVNNGVVPCGSLFPLIASSRPTSVPEPATLALLGIGLAGLGLLRRPRQI